MSTGTYFGGGYDPEDDDDEGLTPFEAFQEATKVAIRLLIFIAVAVAFGVARRSGFRGEAYWKASWETSLAR